MIVFTNGCFDIIHRGHVELLRFAAALGDYLIVGLNSDKSVRAIKGAGRPINSQEDRLAVLKALRFVDAVHLFDEPTPHRLISQLRPHIIVKGGDYKPEEVVGSELAEVVIFPFLDGYSTTGVISNASKRID